MNSGQRSAWLAARLAWVGLGISLIAAVMQFRPVSSEVDWRTYTQGLEESAQTGKPVYVDLYATWCGPCKEMERTTFANVNVRRILTEQYIPVRIDIDTKQFNDTLKARWQLKGVPTSLIVSASGGVLGRRVGFQPPRTFAAWLTDSALLAYAGWLGYPDARRRASDVRKPLLVVFTGNPVNLDEIQHFFLESKFRTFLQERFIVTRIAGDGPAEQAYAAEFRRQQALPATPRDGLLLVTVTPEGRLIGILEVKPEELEDQERILRVLERQLAGA